MPFGKLHIVAASKTVNWTSIYWRPAGIKLPIKSHGRY